MLSRFTTKQSWAYVLPTTAVAVLVLAFYLSADPHRQVITMAVSSCPAAVQKTIVQETFPSTAMEVTVEKDGPTSIFVVRALIDGNDYVVKVGDQGILISKEIVQESRLKPSPQSPRGLTHSNRQPIFKQISNDPPGIMSSCGDGRQQGVNVVAPGHDELWSRGCNAYFFHGGLFPGKPCATAGRQR